ncbi:hypothetical protein C2G38_2083632 [Gigaspora rosea]|uniref:Uncharacterized protein n=1 Tax=Gigaspora rosea TaxID=44941 RepID=A0A397VH42_9GLOM|nr:hypothetical protein C2G38_2083632 [Gigaspora rosea]
MDCPSEVVVWPLLICDLFVAIVFKMFMRLVCMLDSGRFECRFMSLLFLCLFFLSACT